ncbi:unnamed protein product [Chironomus riparius]|uniref:Uncharacterized protein n=1 Tax=Chironomus riparius TaxID=315576 RepID=A0A9N9WX25_9DIPT|nr:unnamed protein product [Chironomus riparius]
MNQNFRILVVFVALLQEINCAVEIDKSLTISRRKDNDRSLTISRKKRLLPVIPPAPPLFPSILYGYNAATGILCAIAVPVALEEYNVFVSYNFEANYNMANVPGDAFPGPLNRLKLTDKYPTVDPLADANYADVVARNMKRTNEDIVEVESENATLRNIDDETTILPETEHEFTKRSPIFKTIFTRVGIYTMLESRLDANEINGKKCLLHAICESAKASFLSGNGILGHIFHILLTPSSSVKEKELPLEYYKAEILGLKGDCTKYEKACNLNVLGLFSTII